MAWFMGEHPDPPDCVLANWASFEMQGGAYDSNLGYTYITNDNANWISLTDSNGVVMADFGVDYPNDALIFQWHHYN